MFNGCMQSAMALFWRRSESGGGEEWLYDIFLAF